MKCEKCNEEITGSICLKCELESIAEQNKVNRRKSRIKKGLILILIPTILILIMYVIFPIIISYIK